MRKYIEKLNRSPRFIYMAGIALGIILAHWYDGQTGSGKWQVVVLGLVFVAIGFLGTEKK